MEEQNHLIDFDYTLSLGLSINTLKEIVDSYIELAHEYQILILQYLEQKDWYNLSTISHKAKGSVSYFGMTKAVGLLKKIQLLSGAICYFQLEEKKKSSILTHEEEKNLEKVSHNEMVNLRPSRIIKVLKLSETDVKALTFNLRLFKKSKNIDYLSSIVKEACELIEKSIIEIQEKKITL